MASTSANADTLSFLDLPAEVRNYIYGYIFEHPDPIIVTNTRHNSGKIALHRLKDDRNEKLRLIRTKTDVKLLPKQPSQFSSS